MSHVSHIQLKIYDLSAIKRACSRMGFRFMENQKTYIWYGKLVEPEKYPLPLVSRKKNLVIVTTPSRSPMHVMK